jgi:hypothetical protein
MVNYFLQWRHIVIVSCIRRLPSDETAVHVHRSMHYKAACGRPVTRPETEKRKVFIRCAIALGHIVGLLFMVFGILWYEGGKKD